MCGCGCGTFPEGPQGAQGPAGLNGTDGTNVHYVATDALVAGIATPNEGDVAVVTSNGNEYEYVSGVWTARLKNMWLSTSINPTGGGGVEVSWFDGTTTTGGPITAVTGTFYYKYEKDTFIYHIYITSMTEATAFNGLQFDVSSVLTVASVPNRSGNFMTAVWDGTENDPSYTTTRMYHFLDTSKLINLQMEGAIWNGAGPTFTKTPPNGMNFTGVARITWP